MILSWRLFSEPNLQGCNIFLLKDFLQPVEALAQNVFETFDESLHTFKTDPDITQIVEANALRTQLSTAHGKCLRALPERYRNSAQLFAVAFDPRKPGQIQLKIPAWVLLSVETKDGELFPIAAPRGENSAWSTLTLGPDDRFLYLEVFNRQPQLRARSLREPQSYRLACLIENAGRAYPLPRLCLPLGDAST